MSDIFKEVDEEFKRDKVAMLFKKYGNLLATLAVLVVVGVGGYRAWTHFEQKKAAEAGKAFEAAMALDNDAKSADAKAAFDAMLKDAPAGYRSLVQFKLASDLSKTDKPAAIKAFDVLAGESGLDQNLRDLARLRAGLLMVDTAAFAEVQQRLEPLTATGQAFRLTAREALAAAALKANDGTKAESYLSAILGDAEATRTFRDRAEMMLALVRSSAPK